jgi:hypothetical protein
MCCSGRRFDASGFAASVQPSADFFPPRTAKCRYRDTLLNSGRELKITACLTSSEIDRENSAVTYARSVPERHLEPVKNGGEGGRDLVKAAMATSYSYAL